MLLARRPAAALPACCRRSRGGGACSRARMPAAAPVLLVAAGRGSAAARRPLVVLAAASSSSGRRGSSSSSSSNGGRGASGRSSSSRGRGGGGGSRGGRSSGGQGGGARSPEQQLAAQIRACRSFEQLQVLLQQHGSSMAGGTAAAAAVHRLVQVQPADRSQRQAVRQLAGQLEALMLPGGLEQCSTQQLANAAWSCGRLRGLVSAAMASACISELVRQQQRISSAQHVSMALHGAATCSAQLPPGQVAQLVTVLLRPAVLKAADPQAIANSVWAAAKMEQVLPAEQVQQLVAALAAKLQQATTQEVSNTLWAVATMEQHELPAEQVQQLVAGLVEKLQQAEPQHVSNTLWALATMQQQVPALQVQARQVQQLVAAFMSKLQEAAPQAISMLAWALAKMDQQLSAQQVQQLVAALAAQLQQAKPQELANTLWAVATMEQHKLPVEQVQQLVAGLVAKLQQAAPQAISNSVWACARLSYLPAQLLAVLEADQQHLQMVMASMNAQDLASTAWACGQLGATSSSALVGAMVQQAVQRLECSGDGGGSGGSFNAQELCNLAWAVAVLDLQHQAQQAHTLARTCSQQWVKAVAVAGNLQQLYQVHLWLLDGQLAGGQGLLGPLTQAQLQQCKQAWDAQLADTTTSQLQTGVLAALRRLPHAWQQQPQAEQLAKPDSALSIDITAVTAGGELLAVEVDGPWHFRRPDGGLMGTTLYRNRALAARGYRVVSVPYQEWNALGRDDEQGQQQYLERLLFGSGQQQARQAGGGKRRALAAAVRGVVNGSAQLLVDVHVEDGGRGGQQQQQQQQGQQGQLPTQQTGRVRWRRRVAVE